MVEKTSYLLETVYQLTKIPVRYYDSASEITLFSRGYSCEADPFLCDTSLVQSIVTKLYNGSAPVIEFEDGIFAYAAYIDSLDCCILLGPVCQIQIDAEQTQQYAKRHSITSNKFFIVHKPLSELYAAISNIYLCLTGRYMRESDTFEKSGKIKADNAIETSEHGLYILDDEEKGTPQADFTNELEYMRLIRDGDLEGLMSYMESFDLSSMEQQIGKFAQKTYKQYEYLACAIITLATRAAIDGGVDPQTAYSLGNLYLQRLEKCTKVIETLELSLNMMKSFIEQVREANEKRSELSYVEKGKVYIMRHLNKPFTLNDIAHEIGVNKSYLSRRFSEAENIGIKEFTQIKRAEAAANMLKFSDESISAISNYLCFPSQSRFGTVFKERFGITPYKYRRKEKVIVFNKRQEIQTI